MSEFCQEINNVIIKDLFICLDKHSGTYFGFFENLEQAINNICLEYNYSREEVETTMRTYSFELENYVNDDFIMLKALNVKIIGLNNETKIFYYIESLNKHYIYCVSHAKPDKKLIPFSDYQQSLKINKLQIIEL